MGCIKHNKAFAGSDGSVKDRRGGHAFCITDNTCTNIIWGSAPTVGSTREMSSLWTEHGGAIGILLLLHALYIYFEADSPAELTIYIDNSEVVRRGTHTVPRLGIKQQLALDYDLWATTERLQEALLCKIRWEWAKGHQTQGRGSKWKLDVEINNFCDCQAELARDVFPSRGG